jgi:hypothetical protein
MYVAKLKDGPKRANKTFLMILERVFKMVWQRVAGGGWNHIKKIFEVEVFFSSQNIDFPFYLRRLLELFFYAPSLEDLGGFVIFEEKIISSKTSFQMAWHGHDYGYTGGGHIFRKGLMHANIAKPWLCRCGSCGYISGGRIFRSGGMHTNISGWG